MSGRGERTAARAGVVTGTVAAILPDGQAMVAGDAVEYRRPGAVGGDRRHGAGRDDDPTAGGPGDPSSTSMGTWSSRQGRAEPSGGPGSRSGIGGAQRMDGLEGPSSGAPPSWGCSRTCSTRPGLTASGWWWSSTARRRQVRWAGSWRSKSTAWPSRLLAPRRCPTSARPWRSGR